MDNTFHRQIDDPDDPENFPAPQTVPLILRRSQSEVRREQFNSVY